MAAAAFFIKKNSTRSLKKAMSSGKETKNTKVVATLHKDGLYAIVVDAENYAEAKKEADAYANKNILTKSKPTVASAGTEHTGVSQNGAANGKQKPKLSTSGASDGGNKNLTITDSAGSENASKGSSSTGDPPTSASKIVAGKKKKNAATDDDDESEDEDDYTHEEHIEAGDHEKKETAYTVKQFLDDFTKHNPKKSKPLLGNAPVSNTNSQIIDMFNLNNDNLGKKKAAWVILPQTGTHSPDHLKYTLVVGTKANSINLAAKAVVVVRSSTFFVPVNDASTSRKRIDKQILVCNAPIPDFSEYGFFKQGTPQVMDKDKIEQYIDETIARIAAFVRRFNEDDVEDKKIELIAVPYMGGSKKRLSVRNNTITYDDDDPHFGANGKKGAKNKASSSASKESQDAEFDKWYARTWKSAIKKLAEMSDVSDVNLMCGDDPWAAHDTVLKSKVAAKIRPFPDCVSRTVTDGTSGHIPDSKIEHTLFLCDRIFGNGVGNGNNIETTGGIFGMYVPMHYVAYPFPDGFEENKWLQRLYASGQDSDMKLVEAG